MQTARYLICAASIVAAVLFAYRQPEHQSLAHAPRNPRCTRSSIQVSRFGNTQSQQQSMGIFVGPRRCNARGHSLVSQQYPETVLKRRQRILSRLAARAEKISEDVVDDSYFNNTSLPPIPLEDLAETTGYLFIEGCHVYLQGVIHGSSTSANEVTALALHPALRDHVKCLVVELDLDRFAYLQERKAGTRRDKSKTVFQTFKRIVSDVREENKAQALLGLLLSSAMRAGESLDFEKGVDFLAAIDAAEELDVPVILADQCTNTTVGRMLREFNPNAIPKHVFGLVSNLNFLLNTMCRGDHGTVSLKGALRRLPRAAQIFLTLFLAAAVSSELPFEWNMAAKHNPALDTLADFERYILLYIGLCLPSVFKVLFAERDLRMLSAISQAVREVSSSSSSTSSSPSLPTNASTATISPSLASPSMKGVHDPLIENQASHSKSSATEFSNSSSVVIAIVGLAHVNSMLNIFKSERFRGIARSSNDEKYDETFDFDAVEKIRGSRYRIRY